MANLLFPLKFKRQYAGALDQDATFATTAELNDYLTSSLRYAGQIATCAEIEGKVFILNNAKDTWLDVSAGEVDTTVQDWASGVQLVDKQLVINEGKLYRTTETYTTGATFEDDLTDSKVELIAGGGGDSGLTEEVTSTLEVGNIPAGYTLTQGKTFTEFVQRLLVKVFMPTYVAPTLALSVDLGANVESGTTGDVTLTANFNRGAIKGDMIDTIWDFDATQNPRAGEATEYTIDGTSTGLTPNRTLPAFQIEDGANTWTSRVDYAEGAQPLDSEGNPFETPLPIGFLTANRTVTGRRSLFHGSDSITDVPYTTSAEVRTLANKQLNPTNGTSFTMNIPAGTKMVTFAYPASLRNVDSVRYVEGLNAEVKGIFSQALIDVEGANGYTAISYKVYTYVPAEPFAESATYNVTI